MFYTRIKTKIKRVQKKKNITLDKIKGIISILDLFEDQRSADFQIYVLE